MKGDFSQLRFRPRDQYSAVRSQQGRVVLDSDWNEQVDIQQYRERLALRDLIGKSGAPVSGGGFKVTVSGTAPAQEIRISAGRIYLDGLLVQNMPHADGEYVEIGDQPYWPEGDAPDPATGTLPLYYLVYLDAWERHITALEDSGLVEPALGGTDTTTRTEVVWVVRTMATTAGATASTTPSEYAALIAGSDATLEARVASTAGAVEPGLGAADGGYRGLENQLYRIEIHTGGAAPTWKWSRDNASVAASVLDKSGVGNAGTQWYLTVSSIGRDPERSFVLDGLVEVSSLLNESRCEPGQMARVVAIDDNVLTVEPLDAAEFDAARFSGDITVRRWDNGTLLELPTDWVELESGVEVLLSGTTFNTGDHWVVPARAETGDILWPRTTAGQPRAEPPLGVRHHYTKLAILKCAAVTIEGTVYRSWSLKTGCEDLRTVFAPVPPPPSMFVRAAYLKWNDGTDSAELDEGETTEVELPSDATWYLEILVNHVKAGTFNSSNFRVSCPGWIADGEINPAFRLSPSPTATLEGDPTPSEENPGFTVLVTWVPDEASQGIVADALGIGRGVPLEVALHYSAHGVVQATAALAILLTPPPPEP